MQRSFLLTLALAAPLIGLREWEYYAVFAPDFAIGLTLTPDFDDSTTLSLGPSYTLTRWKAHGEISGTVQLDDGSELRVAGIRGAAEYVEIIW
jgi:hypothetical protein